MISFGICRLILLLTSLSLAICKQYAVCYIFHDSLQQKVPDNQARIYELNRFEYSVLINKNTKQKYANLNMLKNITNLNADTLLNGNLYGQIVNLKSQIPQIMWVENKQIIIVEIDISTFPESYDEKRKYSSLFNHKGQSFYVFNTQQINSTLQRNLAEVFGLDPVNQQICEIALLKNQLSQNKAKIQQCYRESVKKSMLGKYSVSILGMISQYWLIALIYIAVVSIMTCGSAWGQIKWDQRQKNKYSGV